VVTTAALRDDARAPLGAKEEDVTMNTLITLVAALAVTIATTLAFAQSRGDVSTSSGYCVGAVSRVHGMPIDGIRLPAAVSSPSACARGDGGRSFLVKFVRKLA
jgi:hypothetical protein